jgi:hypothetical protein
VGLRKTSTKRTEQHCRRAGATLFQCANGQLCIADELVETVVLDRWIDLWAEGISIQEAPADGQRLPGDPEARPRGSA